MPADRRHFVKSSTVSAITIASGLAANPPSERVHVALIGCGGMGTNHLTQLLGNPIVQVVAVCDPDAERLARAAKLVEGKYGKSPKAVKDLRTVLDDKDVHAVWIATPDHWHGPAAILAANAGKHVYVEKPCAHNIREGRLMIDAARRNKITMQVGTQSRSTEHVQEAMKRLADGAIGDILVAKAWNSQLRRSIGKSPPAPTPKHIDFDLWVGPAPMVPYHANRVHYGWHWRYAFGTGDMGNDGVHDIDIARWGMGLQTLPVRVAGLGGRYAVDDDQEFPDTQTVIFEFEPKPGQVRQLIYEQRLWSPYVQEGYENGNAWYGTKGMLLLGKSGGWQLFGPKNVPGEKMSGRPDLPRHHANFLDCLKTSKQPNADIEIGHYSASLCHLGNIVCRVGRNLRIDPKGETILEDAEAAKLVKRTYRDGHWAIPQGV